MLAVEFNHLMAVRKSNRLHIIFNVTVIDI